MCFLFQNTQKKKTDRRTSATTMSDKRILKYVKIKLHRKWTRVSLRYTYMSIECKNWYHYRCFFNNRGIIMQEQTPAVTHCLVFIMFIIFYWITLRFELPDIDDKQLVRVQKERDSLVHEVRPWNSHTHATFPPSYSDHARSVRFYVRF